MESKDLYIVLDNIRYSNNLGPIFRVADGINARKLCICREGKLKYTNKQLLILKKISRGVSEYFNWELYQDSIELVKSFKDEGVFIISIDIRTDRIITSPDIIIKYPMAIVFGSEAIGVNPEILALSDQILKIPMYGKGSSLNVASAVAITAYKIRELSN